MDIRFSTDKRGRKIAHRWSRRAHREFRMPLADAELAVATGEATTVYHGPTLWAPGRKLIEVGTMPNGGKVYRVEDEKN